MTATVCHSLTHLPLLNGLVNTVRSIDDLTVRFPTNRPRDLVARIRGIVTDKLAEATNDNGFRCFVFRSTSSGSTSSSPVAHPADSLAAAERSLVAELVRQHRKKFDRFRPPVSQIVTSNRSSRCD